MKRTILLLAAVATFAASCSNDETQDVVTSRAENSIGFYSNTSRAATVTLDALEADVDGFKVYGTTADNATSWMALIDGSQNYRYASSWGWAITDVAWPTTAISYPMNFYAYYAADYSNIVVDATAIAPNVVFEYTAPQVANQIDLLSATANTIVRPKGDKLPLTFYHALSRVGFAVTPGADIDIHMQSINVNNVCNKRKFNVNGAAWDTQDAAAIDDYLYTDTKTPATKYDAAVKIAADDGEVMLIPQSTVSWVPTQGVAPSGAYVDMIYRLESASNVNFVGYKDAADHPQYVAARDAAQYSGKPLFVYVGYPMGTPNVDLVQANSYTFDINLGTDGATNGYLVDDVYYDENGDPTNFEVTAKEIGDPVSDGFIDFTVSVEEWTEATQAL